MVCRVDCVFPRLVSSVADRQQNGSEAQHARVPGSDATESRVLIPWPAVVRCHVNVAVVSQRGASAQVGACPLADLRSAV